MSQNTLSKQSIKLKCYKINGIISNFRNYDTFISNIFDKLLLDIYLTYNRPDIIIFGGFLRSICKHNDLNKLLHYLENSGDIDLFVKHAGITSGNFWDLICNFINKYSNSNTNITYKTSFKYNSGSCPNTLYTLSLKDNVNNKIYKIDITFSKNYKILCNSTNFDISINSLCYDIQKKKVKSKNYKIILLGDIFHDIDNNKFKVMKNNNKFLLIDRVLKLTFYKGYVPDLNDRYTKYYMIWMIYNLLINYYYIFNELHKFSSKIEFINSILNESNIRSKLLGYILKKCDIQKCLYCHNNKEDCNNVFCNNCKNIQNEYPNLYCSEFKDSIFFNIGIDEDNKKILKMLCKTFNINKLKDYYQEKLVNYFISKPDYFSKKSIIEKKLTNQNIILKTIIKKNNLELFKTYCLHKIDNFEKFYNKLLITSFNYNSPNIIKYLSDKSDNIVFNNTLFGTICYNNNLNIIKNYLNKTVKQDQSYIINPKTRNDFIKQDNFCENISAMCSIKVIKYLTKKFNLKFNSNCIKKYLAYNIIDLKLDCNFDKSKFTEYFVENFNENNLICNISNTLNYNDIYCTILKNNYKCYPLLYNLTNGLKNEKYIQMLLQAEYILLRNVSINSYSYNKYIEKYRIIAMSLILFAKGIDYTFIYNNVDQYFI